MQRVRRSPVIPQQRIRRSPITVSAPAPRKNEIVYERVKVEDSPGVFKDQFGGFWKQADGYWLRCYSSGVLKDQLTDGIRVFHGKIWDELVLSPSEERELNAIIRAKMEETFPDSPYLRGRIPLVAPKSTEVIQHF